MSIRVIHAGIQTSVQDAGRPGYQSSGVPLSGAMDDVCFRLANIIAGNAPGTPALEFTAYGATLMAESPMVIAFTGGGAELFINQEPAPSGRAIYLPPYSLIQLKASSSGYRSYLAVSGGLRSDIDLGSVSTYTPAHLGGKGGYFLKSGDVLELTGSHLHPEQCIKRTFRADRVCYADWGLSSYWEEAKENPVIRVTRGREFYLFDEEESGKIFREEFRITEQSNRMGYRLKGTPIATCIRGEMISTAVTKGSVQLTHQGQLVLLMADAQVTGGYPVMAQVAAVDLHLCAAKRPGTAISFREISAEEAEELYLKRERELKCLSEITRLTLNVKR